MSPSIGNGWVWMPVEELAETCSGTTPSRSQKDFFGGSIPWIKTGELIDGVISTSQEHITQEALNQTSLRLLPKGTVLVAMYGQGQTRGRTGLLACEATTNQACFAILPNEKFSPAFVQYWFRHSYQRLRDQTEGRGGNQPNLNGDVLRKERIPVPPLVEQNRIAARLSEQLAEAVQAQASVTAQLQAAEALPAAFLRTVFSTPAALQWPRCKLGDAAEIVGGIQKTPDRAPQTFHKAFLTVRNVQHGFLDLSDVQRFEVTPAEFGRVRLEKGDLLLVEGNGSQDHIGRNALFNEDGDWIHQNHIIRVRLDRSAFLPEFVSRYLNSETGRSQLLEKAKTTTGLYTLSTGKVAALFIPQPHIDEQKLFAAQMKTEFDEVTTLRETLSSKLAAIEKIPATLLREAFSSGI
jgi:type I restriction enzyme S subunit